MIEFQKTSKFGILRDSHYHVAYLNSDLGQGLTSVDGNHQHQIVLDKGQPPQVDPNTGQEIAPGVPGQGWMIQSAEDGHTHDLEPVKVKAPSKSKDDDGTIVSEVLSLWKEASEEEARSIEDGRESEDFYMGEQWEAGAKQTLKSLSRAALTFNRIAKNIDTLSGYQREQRQDIHYAPVKGGKQRAVDILNCVSKNILEQCYFASEESEFCMDQFITGRGLINCYMDFNSDLRGNFKVERYPWDEARFGPHEKKDLSDCEYLVKSRMYSREKIKQLFSDKADEIDACWNYTSTNDPINEPHTQYLNDQYAKSDNRFPMTLGGACLLDIARKEVRLLECWRKMYVKSKVLVNQADDFFLNVTNWNPKDIEKARTIQGVNAIEKVLTQMRITKIACGVVLSDQNPADLPTNDFHLIPVYANKRRNRFWGKVENAKDAQREVNQRRSQTIDIGNKMVAYGWFYDDTIFADDKEREKFLRSSTSPGWQIKLQDISRQPAKVEGVKFPSELVQLIQLANEEIAEAMNVVAEPEGANESGEHLLHKQRDKLRGNEYLFDNLSFAKVKLGRLLVRVVQRYYSPERILEILQSSHEKEQNVQLEGKQLDEYSQEEVLDLIQDTDLTQVDVAVDEADYSPTVRLGLFSVFTKLQQAGIQIPFETLMEFIDVPQAQKDKILEQYAQQQASQSQASDATYKMEINKTLIAKDIIPPEIQADLDRQAQELQAQNQQSPEQFNQNDQTDPRGLTGMT